MAAVEVVAVGDELLLGDVVDTNTADLARRLLPAGTRISRSTAVGDDVDAIRTSAAAAVARRPRAVVVTGGLGPTSDDVTRDALAALAGVGLRRDPALEEGLARWYAARDAVFHDVARRQADLPEGARVLDNPAGSAPGFVVEVDGVPVYALPGVPAELSAMADRHLVPELADPGQALLLRTLHVVGLGESDIATRLAPLEADLPAGVGLAYLAGGGEVRVKLSAAGTGPARRLDPLVGRARSLLGEALVGEGDEGLPVAVHRLLRAAGATVAVAESLTGGALGAALTGVPGASTAFRGGVIAYATPLKAALLGVDPVLLDRRGPVDPDVALAMAEGVRRRLDATYGLSTTGVAGPDPQDGVPVGTVFVAVVGPAGARVVPLRRPGAREVVRDAAVVAALDALRRLLLEMQVAQH